MAKAKKANEEKKIGRPTKYDEKTVATILAWLRDGSTRRAAALAAGISHETFYSWLNDFSDFSDAVMRAEGECEAQLAQTMVRASRMDWRAAESWLKRRRKDEWSEKTEVQHSGGTTNVVVNSEEFKQLAETNPNEAIRILSATIRGESGI